MKFSKVTLEQTNGTDN